MIYPARRQDQLLNKRGLQVLVSKYNALDDGRYYDVESSSSFAFDHTTQVRLSLGCALIVLLTYSQESVRSTIIHARINPFRLNVRAAERRYIQSSLPGDRKSLLKAFSSHAAEHYPSSAYSVFPTENDSELAIVLVANRYSPTNFW
jgi:capping protein (actin filament) muscle Z-line, alpha